ncbi:insulinase family protein [Paludibacter sp. 221]|uniref:M16 family metallopeptidase n=1 Tax=Paludibacter sp. 221 TaxID=2302939 RepID=UPI0013D4C886|nr:insulinase family protein [Paludibacter sp. 221]NDV47726.1 insulinase family protein [Paludibacter sp. 221]
MITKKSKIVVLSLLATLSLNLFAQQLQTLPIDPKIRYGQLENGLTYYIRHNENPKERAEFYIAQNVGAILENDDQDGLAHFLEHMAFNGTKNYPGKGIIEYFESIGVKFGSNINAYTSLDETVYNLSNVPTVRESVIDSALLVLHDWSSFIALEAEEIDAERGVILEEWRTGQGANRRLWKELNKTKYPDSQYAIRDVIGDTAVIKNFDHQSLRDFYHRWYRPDLQAVLVVGDVDVDVVEEKIKILFADIPRKENFGERPVYPIHDNEQPIVAIATDPEARNTQIGLEYKQEKLPAEFKLSVNGYLVHTINSLISMMMNNRFDEITQQADAPFVAGFAYYGELVKSKDALHLIVVPHEGRELEGLNALLLEAEKVKRFGFTSSELERAKSDMQTHLEKLYNERDNQQNNSLIREYARHFLTDEPIPGIEWEYTSLQQMLPQLEVDMVNRIAKAFIPEDDSNMIVSIAAPEKPEVIIPGEEQILESITNVKLADLLPREEDNLNKPLIEKAPKAGKVKKVTQNNALGTTEWMLSNGIKVIFKPTKFKQDEILMTAYSDGGLSKIDEVEDLPSAAFSTMIVQYNGLADYNNVELKKLLTGKIVNVKPYIENYDEGFSGNSSVKDFETMMQLTYLYFTAPRKDDNAFQAMTNMFRTSLANRDKDPQAAFSDSVNVTSLSHNPRLLTTNLETINKIDQDKAIEIYKARFAMPADFIFIFTGNINPDDKATKEIICTYLGGLKSKKGKESYVDRNIRYAKGDVKNYFAKEMQVKKASNFIMYNATIPYNLQNMTTITAIRNILNMRYMESIREKEGGSYGVRINSGLSKIPVEQAVIRMQFDTDPEKQERLIGIIHQEINEIINNGPRADDLQKVKENLLKQYEEDLNENPWWRRTLVNYYKNDIDFVTDYKKSVEALDQEMIQSLLKQIAEQNNVLEVVMMPKE